jgi:hypothetical protein
MMVSLLLHGYASGLYSSRRIARACCERNDFVMIVALDPPDFRSEDWTCRSIAEHGMPALKASFYPVVAARPRALDARAHAPSQP